MAKYQCHIHFIKDKNQKIVDDVIIEASCFDEVYEKIKKSKQFLPNFEILCISKL